MGSRFIEPRMGFLLHELYERLVKEIGSKPDTGTSLIWKAWEDEGTKRYGSPRVPTYDIHVLLKMINLELLDET
jgi:hypothetical protein